jgi:hypothetical protein
MEPPELALTAEQCSTVAAPIPCLGSVDFVTSQRERMVAGELYDAGNVWVGCRAIREL